MDSEMARIFDRLNVRAIETSLIDLMSATAPKGRLNVDTEYFVQV
jgi:hypothetical protein